MGFKNTVFEEFKKNLFSFELVFSIFLISGLIKESILFSWLNLDLTLLTFVLSTLLGLFILLRHNCTLTKYRIKSIFLFSIFIFITVVSTFWTLSEYWYKEKLLRLIFLNGWAFFGATIILSNKYKRILRFFRITFLLSLVIAFHVFYQYLQNSRIFLGTPTYLGISRFLSLGLVIAFANILNSSKRVVSILSFFFILLQSMGILILGGRGPLISLLIWIVFLLLINTNKRSFASLKVLVILIIVFTIIFLLIQNNYFESRTLNRISLITRSNNMGESFNTRLYYYKESLSLFSEKPFFGHGIGSWGVKVLNLDLRAYPHNIFLEIIVEMGLIGLLAFAALLVFFVKNALYLYKTNTLIGTAISGIFLVMFINAMFSADLAGNRLFYFSLGLVSYRPKQNKNILNG